MATDQATNSSRRRFLTAIAVAGTGAFAGCSSQEPDDDSPVDDGTDGDGGATGDDTPDNGEGSTGGHLNVGIQVEDMSSLDPHLIERDVELQVLVNLYNGLISLNSELEPEPDLAEDWEWDSDTEVTFYLREGVQFHDGSTLTAEDVKFSFERVLDEDFGSPWRSQFLPISNVVVQDETTVTLELDAPFAPLEAVIVRKNMGGCILSQEAVENGSDPATEPIGTGPFQFETWASGSHLEFSKFDDSWESDSTHLDGVTVEFIPDGTTMVTALEADDIAIIDSVPSQDYDRLNSNSEIQIHDSEGLNVRYMGFNHQDGNVFSERRLRQAASLSISRDNLISVLGEAFAPNHSPIPQALEWVYEDNLPMQSQDTDQARQLLEEANAVDTPVTIISMNEDPWRQMASVAQNQMNEVGFDVTVELFESGTFFDKVFAFEYDAFVLGWTGLTDPDQYMFAQFSTEAEWNWVGYSNSELDDILVDARREVDRSARRELYRQAQEIVAEDAAYACLASQKDFQASRSYVQGYEMPPTGTLRFVDTTIE